MKADNKEFYFYKKAFRPFFEKRNEFIDTVKGHILSFITNNSRISNWLQVWESFSFANNQWIKKYTLQTETPILSNNFKDILMKEVHFFEVIDIDNFHQFRKKLISKFGKSANRGFKIIDTDELKKKLFNIENKFDYISTGSLLTINLKKRRNIKNDLIDSINFEYIKTNESYFIISLQVRLSEKFHKVFEKIACQKDVPVSIPTYYSFLKILMHKRFYSYTSYKGSLNLINKDNLVSDLNYQVKHNVTKHFNGYFHNSKNFEILPSIEFYEVNDIIEFNKHTHPFIESDFGRYFSLEDQQVEVHFNDSDNKRQLIQVLKQKGHATRPVTGNDYTNYDSLENYYILKSLIFPCVFSAILRELTNRLNSLKRNIYDQIKISKNSYSLKYLLFRFRNKSYLTLKHNSIQILTTLKRFESEFATRNLQFYIDRGELRKFIGRNFQDPKVKDLSTYYIEGFRAAIKLLDSKTKSLNDIFKSLEEFNNYKTNLFLQLFSITVSVLAFIFAFERTKEFFKTIFNGLFHYW